MKSTELKNRTKEFAKKVIRLTENLPNKRVGWTISDQIIRACTSVASNYRAVCRAKSYRDFIYRIGIVIEETDETQFWLEMIYDLKLINEETEVKLLIKEADELISIFVASIKTVKKRTNHKT